MPQKQLLDKLFESVPKVRILRLFLSNPDELFTRAEIASKTKTDMHSVRQHVSKLASIGLIQKKKRAKKKD